jgi:hypothetical protein
MQVPTRLALVCLTLAAPAAGGCGGGDGASTSPQTAKLLADTFGAAKPMRSGRIDLTLDVRARGLPNLHEPLVARVTGPFQSTVDVRFDVPRDARPKGSAQQSGSVRFDLAFAALNQEQAIGPPAHARPVAELAAAMRQVLGGNRRYEQCLQDADADLAKAQACAELVGQ